MLIKSNVLSFLVCIKVGEKKWEKWGIINVCSIKYIKSITKNETMQFVLVVSFFFLWNYIVEALTCSVYMKLDFMIRSQIHHHEEAHFSLWPLISHHQHSLRLQNGWNFHNQTYFTSENTCSPLCPHRKLSIAILLHLR